MKPFYKLPENYQLQTEFSLTKDNRTVRVMSVVGGVSFVILSLIAVTYSLTRLDAFSENYLMALIGGLILGFILVPVVHMALEGSVFWLATGQKPVLVADLDSYAYIIAQDWYFPRNIYLVMKLTPVVVMTAVPLILLPVIPVVVGTVLLLMIALNIGGSIAKLLIVGHLWAQSAEAVVQDTGLNILVYLPQKAANLPPSSDKKEFPQIKKEKTAADMAFDILDLKEQEKAKYTVYDDKS